MFRTLKSNNRLYEEDKKKLNRRNWRGDDDEILSGHSTPIFFFFLYIYIIVITIGGLNDDDKIKYPFILFNRFFRIIYGKKEAAYSFAS